MSSISFSVSNPVVAEPATHTPTVEPIAAPTEAPISGPGRVSTLLFYNSVAVRALIAARAAMDAAGADFEA